MKEFVEADFLPGRSASAPDTFHRSALPSVGRGCGREVSAPLIVEVYLLVLLAARCKS